MATSVRDEIVAFPSVVTEHRSGQAQDLATDAIELNGTIVGRGISRDARYRVDGKAASRRTTMPRAISLTCANVVP